MKPLIHSYFIIQFFQIQNDPEFKNKLKAQALIYPGLQVIDISIPSHRENEHGPFLSKKLALELACLYLTQDKALPQAMMKNQHMPHGSIRPVPLGTIKTSANYRLFPPQTTATSTSRWPETGVVATRSRLKALHTCGQEPVPATGSEGAVCALR